MLAPLRTHTLALAHPNNPFDAISTMADLDDFFAKKDRKKKPTKKFATPEELAKKIDETVAIAKKAEIKVAPPPPPRKEAVLPEGAVADETVEAEEVRFE